MKTETDRFILREFARSGANLLKLGIPLAVAGAALAAPALMPGGLPLWASALAWGTILGTVGVVFILRRVLRGDAESAFGKSVASLGDPGTVAAEIERAAASGEAAIFKRLVLCGDWAIVRKIFSTAIFRLQDLMWHYRSETQHYVNGIKGQREIAVYFHLRSGGSIKLGLRNAQEAMELSEAVAARAPWAVAGYMMGLEDSWKADRAGWIAEVDARRLEPAPRAGDRAVGKGRAADGAPSLRKPRAGLVFGLGLGSLFVPLPIGIAAAVLGFQDKAEQAKGRMEPSGLTTAGIVLGIFGTCVQALAIAMIALNPPR